MEFLYKTAYLLEPFFFTKSKHNVKKILKSECDLIKSVCFFRDPSQTCGWFHLNDSPPTESTSESEM